MHPELDLQRSIRPGLDLLANEIVIALKKRTRFARNPAIYAPGLVRGQPELSLLRYELARVEQLHAELGRYTFASQESFTDVADVQPVIERAPPADAIVPMPGGVSEALLVFYLDWVHRGCAEGSNPHTYGETVTADVGALLCMLERVNLGKYVAEAKLTAEPAAFRAARDDREALMALIVKPEREAKVYELARRLAAHYDVNEEEVEAVFRWMIGATIDVEIAYVRARLRD